MLSFLLPFKPAPLDYPSCIFPERIEYITILALKKKKKKEPVVDLIATSKPSSEQAKPRRRRDSESQGLSGGPGEGDSPACTPIRHPGRWLRSPSSEFTGSFDHPAPTSPSRAISTCL